MSASSGVLKKASPSPRDGASCTGQGQQGKRRDELAGRQSRYGRIITSTCLLVVELVEGPVERWVAVEEAVERGPEQVMAGEEEGGGDHRVGQRQLPQAAPHDLRRYGRWKSWMNEFPFPAAGAD